MMRYRWLGGSAMTLAAVAALAAGSAGTAGATTAPAGNAAPANARPAGHSAPAHSGRAVLAIGGAVSAPENYTSGQLAALPTETVSLPGPYGHGTVTATGVSLDRLVTAASPVLPTAKNALLRVIVTASGPRSGPVSFALGELDPDFGNHDAVVVLKVNGRPLPGPALAVPGDRVPVRDLPSVNRIRVGVTNPAVIAPPSAGGLVIEAGRHRAVLSAAALARLPEETKTVSFGSDAGTQTHTETGPTLASVLRAAHLITGLNTWVAAVGDDGYVATVTPAEASAGGRPLLISLAEDGTALAEPRLVTDGDVKGGRYVSGTYDLVVGQGAPAS